MPQTFTRAALMELLSVNTEKTIANYVKKGWLRKTLYGKQYEILDEKLQKIVSEKMRTNSENFKADSETLGNVPNHSENNEILEFIKAEREEIQQKLDDALVKVSSLERETGEWKGRFEVLNSAYAKLESKHLNQEETVLMLTEKSEYLTEANTSTRKKLRIVTVISIVFLCIIIGGIIFFMVRMLNI